MSRIAPISLAIIAVACLIHGERAESADPPVSCRETDDAIELLAHGRPILRYHTAVVEPPRGIDPVYRRSGFIHPVTTPAGRVVTADFPADHAHQHGLFAAWVKTTFEGREVDFWNQSGKTGAVEHVRTVGIDNQEDSAAFTVELRHSDLTAPDGPRPVLREFWTVRRRDVANGYLFDIDSRQTCIADSPLIVHEYHYGGMAFRGCDDWFSSKKDEPAPFAFLTSEGLNAVDGNHTRPNWVVNHGQVDGAECGIAVMGHPDNLRHPEPVRLHPTKPYFVFSPCVLGEFRLEPGVEHRSRYRYLVFDGPPDRDEIAAAWHAYSHDTDGAK